MKMHKIKSGSSNYKFIFLIVMVSIAMFFVAILSVVYGAADISFSTVFNSIFHFDSTNLNHQVIVELRIPRTIGNIFIGAAFATAGAVMQGMTRNPLADSGLLGINAGAAFALAVCFAFFPKIPYGGIVFVSFMGAAVSMALVYGVVSYKHGKMSPVRLVLAGSAVTSLLIALSQAIAMYYKIGLEITFWTSGGVAGIRMSQLMVTVPVIIIALFCAICLSRTVSILSLGEDVAKGLGLNITTSKLLCMVVVLVLAGTSVALAGSITFVGLIIPHIVRHFVGTDYGKIIPGAMVTGSFFMVLADLISRLINAPHETPIGLIFAIIGVPFFLYISRGGRSEYND